MINDKIKIDNIKINYVQYGSGNTNMVLLHGWGQNIKMMMPIGNAFKSMFKITIIDLPGFGESDEPNQILTIGDYANIVNKILTKLKIENPILIGHSFGGRISIAYASKYSIKKLVLLASPFEKRNKKVTLKEKCLKTLNKIPVLNKLENWAKNHFGSEDYRHSSPMMRKILVQTVNTDLTKEAGQISVPTLIIQGDNDTAVPLEEAKRLKDIIKDSGLVIFENKTHYAYLEDINKTISVLDKFLYQELGGNHEN